MNTDIRISVSFRSHRKRKRLHLLLGPGSTDYLIDLWLSTAMNHPSGVLSGMDELDISLEAGWEGDSQKFVSALLECGFLDKTESGDYCLHDWEDHQGYVVHADVRKEKARKAAQKRWGTTSDAQSMPQACPEHATRNAPSPTPIPDPKPEENKIPPIAPPRGTDGDVPPAFDQFWRAYPKKTGKTAALKAWKNAKGKPDLPVLLAALEKQKTWPQWQRDGGQYIPNPATWLNQGRWNDEPPETQARASPPGRIGFGQYSGGGKNYGQSDFGAFGVPGKREGAT